MITIDLKTISKNRTTIMGMAMLLVMFFHSSIELSGCSVLAALKDMGDVGVDIFLMMSGFGIYCSLKKDDNLHRFYKKRLLRILPAYLLINGVWYAVFNIRGGGVS